MYQRIVQSGSKLESQKWKIKHAKSQFNDEREMTVPEKKDWSEPEGSLANGLGGRTVKNLLETSGKLIYTAFHFSLSLPVASFIDSSLP